MKKTIVFAMMALLMSVGAARAGWVVLDKTRDGRVTYFNDESVKRNGQFWNAEIMHDNLKAVYDNDARSMKQLRRFDCKNNTTQALNSRLFSGKMGGGSLVHEQGESPKEYVQPGSTWSVFIKGLCQ